MPYDYYTTHKRAVRIRLDVTASRPPGRGRDWTVESGHWRASARTEAAAADVLTAGLNEYLTHYQPPKILTFRGYTAILHLDLGGEDGALKWTRHTVKPDGRQTTTSFGAASWNEAEAEARTSLAWQSTDWHDDASVHEAASFLDRAAHNAADIDDRYCSVELYRYAAWQRAAQAAMESGQEDFHAWATTHREEFTVPRPAPPHNEASPTATPTS